MARIADIEGIGPSYAEKLAGAGIKTTDKLLEMGGTPKGRKEIATKSGVTEKLILGWVNRADLTRIKGVGSEYADLLECAGVDTVPELKGRSAKNLHAKMAEVNEKKKLVRKLPTENQVTEWVAQAKKLKRAVSY
ncbi:MAG: DUF4332 domain-containing protein [Gammaproteobacteria bacterium]|nr:DUF4332 domain-containing protein [Gammaproteobacteria bacterium]NNF60993.1 DUF4332 domain-containing protein [Gammaproteobacteria bacterium]NNM21093.1 DUF4332 domain-containing protein [Gammaproteobacteria bacterium]